MHNIAAVNIRLQYNIQSVIIVYEVEYNNTVLGECPDNWIRA